MRGLGENRGRKSQEMDKLLLLIGFHEILISRNEDDPDWIRQMLKSNPDQLALLKQNNPRLAEALESNPDEFAKVFFFWL